MGLPASVTSWCRRSISEKAACRPYWWWASAQRGLGRGEEAPRVWGLAYPLGLELLAALADGDVVLKGGLVVPQAQLGERGPAGEEVEDAADNGLLLAAELDARGRLDVCALNVEVWSGAVSVLVAIFVVVVVVGGGVLIR